MAPVPMNNQDQVLLSMPWSYVLSSYISWFLFLIKVGLLWLYRPPRENQNLFIRQYVLYIALFLISFFLVNKLGQVHPNRNPT